MMSRLAVLGFAVLAYAVFLLSSAWAIGFLAGWGDGPATSTAWVALTIDTLLLLAFAVQHTVMARAGFKRRLVRFVPAAAGRSVYVLTAGLLLLALFAFWQPLPTVLWDVGRPWSALLWTLYAAGWVVVVGSTFMVDHADFLGLKQAYLHLRLRAHRPPTFKERLLYGWVRHPMMLGLLITFWATPRLTAGHLFFAGAATAYIVVGIRFEERDLRAQLGAPYEDYTRRVPALVPLMPGRRAVRLPRGAAAAHAAAPDVASSDCS
nr:isoprenylcysteine carboxylmethyltransferase family protein [uncultured Actinoplanes sp.]